MIKFPLNLVAYKIGHAAPNIHKFRNEKSNYLYVRIIDQTVFGVLVFFL